MSRIAEKSDRVVIERNGMEIRFNRHPRRSNNFVVAGMYEAYKSGKSLEEIGKIYRKKRQAVYDVFRSRGYPLRTKKLAGLTVIDGIKFTNTKGGHLRGTVPGKGRMTAHKYIWEKYNGPLPARHVIIFSDGNKNNFDIKNLEIIPFSGMQKRFNPTGINQFTKKI